MSRRCELTGTNRQIGHLVSHSNVKTKRSFQPNLVNVSLQSDTLRKTYRLRVTAAALRSVDHVGGLDAFLQKAKEADLSQKAAKIRRSIRASNRASGYESLTTMGDSQRPNASGLDMDIAPQDFRFAVSESELVKQILFDNPHLTEADALHVVSELRKVAAEKLNKSAA